MENSLRQKNCNEYIYRMHPFKHKVPIQLRFKDADLLGHVNNANHLTYVELARTNYFEQVVGMNEDWNQQQGIILAHLSIDYKMPFFLKDTVFVYTRCSRIGKKSIELSWAIVRLTPGGEEIIAQGNSIVVCYDYALHTSIEVPVEYRTRIESFERG